MDLLCVLAMVKPISGTEILQLLKEMIVGQREKVLQIARQHNPSLTYEDIRNPHDFACLAADPHFHFEDGILSGYIAVQMAVLNELAEVDKKEICF